MPAWVLHADNLLQVDMRGHAVVFQHKCLLCFQSVSDGSVALRPQLEQEGKCLVVKDHL